MEWTESRLGGVGGFGRDVDERGGLGGDGALLGPEGGLDAEGALLGGAGGLLGGAPEARLGGAGGLLGVAETFATEGGGREGGGFGGASGDGRGADTEGRVDGVGGRDSLGLRASLPLPASSEELDGRGGTDPPGRGGIDLVPSGRGGSTLLLLSPPAAAAFFDARLPLPPRAPFDELFDSSADLAAGPASGDVLSSPIAFDRNSWFFREYTQTPDDAAATSQHARRGRVTVPSRDSGLAADCPRADCPEPQPRGITAPVSAQPSLHVVKNVRVIDPGRELDEELDVVVEHGRISRVGRGAAQELADVEAARVIDGSGQWLLPAFVDLHAHLREPGYEYKEDVRSGLEAAAAGGYAHVCVMPNTNPVNDTRAVTELMLQRAQEAGGPKLHPIGAITRGQRGEQLTEMAELREAGAVAVSDDGVCVMSSAIMRSALEYARNFDLPVIQHAEDHDLTRGAQMNEGATSERLGLRGWPRVAEDVIIARDVILAEYLGARYHAAHISTRGAVRILREAKSRNLPVTCEVTPHHLLLTDAAVIGYDTACKVNPPLREAEDVEALHRAFAEGCIDAIATDHAPHSPLEKDCEFEEASPGMLGLELCFGLLLSLVGQSGITLSRLIDALTAGPCRVVGIETPRIQEERTAEMVLVDPRATWVPRQTKLKTKSMNTPFLDRKITGRIMKTWAGGKLVFEHSGAES